MADGNELDDDILEGDVVYETESEDGVVAFTLPQAGFSTEMQRSWAEAVSRKVASMERDLRVAQSKIVNTEVLANNAVSIAGGATDEFALEDGEDTEPDDIEPPNQPSAPQVTSRMGSLEIFWDGTDFEGTPMTSDTAVVNVYAVETALLPENPDWDLVQPYDSGSFVVPDGDTILLADSCDSKNGWTWDPIWVSISSAQYRSAPSSILAQGSTVPVMTRNLGFTPGTGPITWRAWVKNALPTPLTLSIDFGWNTYELEEIPANSDWTQVALTDLPSDQVYSTFRVLGPSNYAFYFDDLVISQTLDVPEPEDPETPPEAPATSWPPRAIGSIVSTVAGGNVVFSDLAYNTEYTVWFLAQDRSGNRSVASERATASVQPLVNTDVIGRVIDEANIELGAINEELLAEGVKERLERAEQGAEEAMESADGKNTIYFRTSLTPPDAPAAGFKVGDTWFVTDEGNRILRWDGTLWTEALLGTMSIADAAIINAKIANLDAAKITSGFINSDRIEANSIVGGKIVAGSIAGDRIAGNTITGDKITGNTITGDKIAALTIAAGNIQANAITGEKIAADAIDGRTITGVTITGGTLQLSDLADNTVKFTDPCDSNVNWSNATVNTAIKQSGTGSLRANAGKVAGTFHMQLNTTIPSGTSSSFDVTFWCYNLAASARTLTVSNGSGTTISQISIPPTAWTQVTVTANGVFSGMAFTMSGASSFHIDTLSVRGGAVNVSGLKLYRDQFGQASFQSLGLAGQQANISNGRFSTFETGGGQVVETSLGRNSSGSTIYPELMVRKMVGSSAGSWSTVDDTGHRITSLESGAAVATTSFFEKDRLRFGFGGTVESVGDPLVLAATNIDSNRTLRELYSSPGTYMGASQSVNLGSAVNSCLNGIILVWSEYSGGSGTNAQWNFTAIPKRWNSSGGISLPIHGFNETVATRKYVYFNGQTLTGHASNSTGTPGQYVLRFIYGY